MSYVKKLEPTLNGFEKLWESTKNTTIDRLIAGIQCKKTSEEDILNLTAEMRESHSLLDKELFRLGVFSSDYNSKWATKKTYDLGEVGELQNKIRSQVKRWMKFLSFTTPRFKPSLEGKKEQKSYVECSYLTCIPYQKDMWGPASYGTLVTDLYAELEILIKHLDEGERLCKEILHQEQMINQDPDWKELLYDNQFKDVEEKSRELIEQRYKQGNTSTTSPLLKQMMSYPTEYDYKVDFFHKPTETSFNTFVVDLSALRLLDNDITPTEYELWGDDNEKIKQVRMVITNLDKLISTNKNGKFDKFDILDLIKWCNVNKNKLKHKDNEHKLYDYLKLSYKGGNSWPSWSTVFGLNKTAKEQVNAPILYATRFESKLNRMIVDMKSDEDNVQRLNG